MEEKYMKDALSFHEKLKGKIEMKSRVSLQDKATLAMAYTPGVAQPCLEIKKDINKSYTLTRRWNTVAVVSDGSAVLGLGDIGAEASMPVMEGKCILFKEFGDVDAIPLCIKSKDVDEFVKTIQLLSGSFGGINLEDISAPRCFEIEKRLKEVCDIPVFHDDQHGTAMVICAALINALKLVHKNFSDIKVVLNGPGAAGTATIYLLQKFGVNNIIAVDEYGILNVNRKEGLKDHKLQLAKITNLEQQQGSLKDALKHADVFIGTSIGNCLTQDMIKCMNDNPIIFACANPIPEIFPVEAKAAGAAVVCTGRSDFPNQVNNVLVFPGLFRGVLDARASEINDDMMKACSYAIANLIKDEELNQDYILPSIFDLRIKDAVSNAIIKVTNKKAAV